jgi:hypothetical protein
MDQKLDIAKIEGINEVESAIFEIVAILQELPRDTADERLCASGAGESCRRPSELRVDPDMLDKGTTSTTATGPCYLSRVSLHAAAVATGERKQQGMVRFSGQALPHCRETMQATTLTTGSATGARLESVADSASRWMNGLSGEAPIV